MLDGVEESRLLDILGNRNRRRIIGLLRQKPCFVTEISDKLTISPKAVIEHLHMMEQERIISCQLDSRRRKYYYLTNDIYIVVQLQRQEDETAQPLDQRVEREFVSSLAILRKMVAARENLIANLTQLERDIDLKVNDILQTSRDVLQNEQEVDLIFALAHYDLTREELQEYTGVAHTELNAMLESLMRRGIIEQTGSLYILRGIHAK